MILCLWLRTLSFELFPSEILSVIIDRFTYRKQMDQNLHFIRGLLKVLLVGKDKVGKTALVSRWGENKFIENYEATIGVDFLTKTLDANELSFDEEVLLQIWDTAGQERFQSLGKAYYRGASVAMFCYDVTNRQSLMDIKTKWLSGVNRSAEDALKVLVGNKCDLKGDKACSEQDVAEIVKECGIEKVVECSAKDDINVDALFMESIRDHFVDEKDKDQFETFPFWG